MHFRRVWATGLRKALQLPAQTLLSPPFHRYLQVAHSHAALHLLPPIRIPLRRAAKSKTLLLPVAMVHLMHVKNTDSTGKHHCTETRAETEISFLLVILKTTSNPSQHNFLGCKRVFQADWVCCVIFWQCLFPGAGPPEGTRTSPAHQPPLRCGCCSSLTTPALTEPSPVILWRHGSYSTAKMRLLIQTCLLGRPTCFSKLTAKDEWPSTPTT